MAMGYCPHPSLPGGKRDGWIEGWMRLYPVWLAQSLWLKAPLYSLWSPPLSGVSHLTITGTWHTLTHCQSGPQEVLCTCSCVREDISPSQYIRARAKAENDTRVSRSCWETVNWKLTEFLTLGQLINVNSSKSTVWIFFANFSRWCLISMEIIVSWQ